jgi:hypothetical protein
MPGGPFGPPGIHPGVVMENYLNMARRYLWIFAEIGFLLVLVSLLAHLVLGEASGGFIKGVYDNVVAFGKDVPSATLLGVAALMLLVWYIQQRTAENREKQAKRK